MFRPSQRSSSPSPPYPAERVAGRERSRTGAKCFLAFARALFLITILGCDKSPPTPSNTAPIAPTVDVRPITPLLPRLKTHLALDAQGNLYWTQESDPPLPGGDLVFVMGQGGVPQTLPALDLDRILQTLNVPDGQGAIQSLTVGPDDHLYILFAGSRGRTATCAVLQYVPSTRKLTVAAETSRLMDESKLGPSIVLARGTLLGSRDALWLWLRHTDGVALLKLTSGLSAAFDIRKIDLIPPAQAKDLRLTTNQEDLALTQDSKLYFLDRAHATLWRIAPDGKMAAQMSLVDVSRAIAAPAGNRQSLFFLVPPDGKFTGPDVILSQPPSPLAHLDRVEPALLEYSLTDGAVRGVGRTHMTAPANLPLQSLQPRQLLWDAATGTLVTFDASSGEILRLKLSNP